MKVTSLQFIDFLFGDSECGPMLAAKELWTIAAVSWQFDKKET